MTKPEAVQPSAYDSSSLSLRAERVVEEARRLVQHENQVSPHEFDRAGWRWWICRHCYAPKPLHPRTEWVKARPCGDTTYLSKDAPHFKEGW